VTDGLQIFDVLASADDAEDAAATGEAEPRRRPRWPGAVAAALAILMVVTWALALACSLAEMLELGVGLSISAMLLSVPAVVLGLVAVIANFGRGWGIVAVAVGILLNPVVLLYGLTWIGAL
jgi:hypothetical protein